MITKWKLTAKYCQLRRNTQLKPTKIQYLLTTGHEVLEKEMCWTQQLQLAHLEKTNIFKPCQTF
jgi:hypothetical protein